MEIKLASLTTYLIQSFWILAFTYQLTAEKVTISDVSERQQRITIFLFIVFVGLMNFLKSWANRDKVIVETKLLEEELKLKQTELDIAKKKLELLEKFEKYLEKFEEDEKDI